MEDKVLLENLITQGILTKETADKIAKEAVLSRKSAEDIIYDRRIIAEADVARMKSQQFKIPYKKISPDDISKEILSVIPEEVARAYKLVPISKTKDMLIVGMMRPDDPKAQDALRFIAKQQKINLGVYIITPGDLDLILRITAMTGLPRPDASFLIWA